MKFRELIDGEELILDSKRLAEFNKRSELTARINDVAEKFIDNNVSADDFETITLIYRLINEVKYIIWGEWLDEYS